MWIRSGVQCVVALFCLPLCVLAVPWEVLQYSHALSDFSGVATGLGSFVVVGDELIVRIDPDARLSLQTAPSFADLHAVARNSKDFVAVGQAQGDPDTGVVVAGADGNYWREVYRGVGEYRGVAWGHGQWLVLTDRGVVVGDSTLRVWHEVELGEQSRDALHHAVWTGSRWIGVGEGGPGALDPSGWIVTSPDGYSWATVARPAGQPLTRVAWNGTRAVAVGMVPLASTDGVNWTQATDEWVGNAVIWDGQRFVAVGSYEDEYAVVSLVGTSADGLSWESGFGGFGHMVGLAFDGVHYEVVGAGTLASSTDLETWAVPETGMPVDAVDHLLPTDYGVMAIGSQGEETFYDTPRSYVGSSETGTDWEWTRIPRGCWVGSAAYRDGTTLVVCRDGERFGTSNDRENWSWSDGPESPVNLVVAGDPGYVVVTDDDRLFFSSDTEIWIESDELDLDRISVLEWVNESYVVAGRNGMAVSTNGQTWELDEIDDFGRTLGFAGDGSMMVRLHASGIDFQDSRGRWNSADVDPRLDLRDVAWVGDHFVAVGDHGDFAASEDGELWTSGHTGWPFDLVQVVDLDGRYLAAGESSIMAEPQAPPPRRSGGRRGY